MPTMTRPRLRGAASCLRSTDAALALALTFLVAGTLSAQVSEPVPMTIRAEPSGESAALVYFNRPILTLKARVLGRGPAERAQTAVQTLDSLVTQRITGPIELSPFDRGILVRIASRGVVAITPPDINELEGETLDAAAQQAAARLGQALAEAAEAHTPRVWLRAIVTAALALVVAILVIWALLRLRLVVIAKLVTSSARALVGSGVTADVVRASRLIDFERGLVTTLFAIPSLVVAYVSVTFALRRFPYTRPWGESMSALMLAALEHFGLNVAHALPGLFTVALIILLTRFLARLVRLWFDAIEAGRTQARWIHPETAQPTRRLFTGLLWIFALVMAYPYLPGSDSEAFKGVSVFLGVLVTLGSSGLVNQIMSGFVI